MATQFLVKAEGAKMPEGSMAQYAVYSKETEDYPGLHVCRRFWIVPGRAEPLPEMNPFMATEDLEEIHERLHGLGLIPLSEEGVGDPVVLECWI